MSPEARDRPGQPLSRFAAITLIAILALSTLAYIRVKRWADAAYVDSHLAIASEVARLHLISVVERELTLMEKLADTEIIRLHMLSPQDEILRERAESEIRTYQILLREGDIYWSSAQDRILWSLADGRVGRVEPEPGGSSWYDETISAADPYLITVKNNPNGSDPIINLNVAVPSYGKTRAPALGVVGSSIDTSHLADLITGAVELLDEELKYYIYEDDLRIVSTNDWDALKARPPITDVFPQLKDIIEGIPATIDSRDSTFSIGQDRFLLRGLPRLGWTLVLHFPVPAIVTINRSIAESFLSMLIICLATWLVFLSRLARVRRAAANAGAPILDSTNPLEELRIVTKAAKRFETGPADSAPSNASEASGALDPGGPPAEPGEPSKE
jgi:hypothetical protein